MNFKTIIQLILHPKSTYRRIGNAFLFKSAFTEIFIQEEYSWLMKQIRPQTTVLDIGGLIGDTALYFAASKNVKQVISYEPDKRWYDSAIKYTNLSQYKKKITLINSAIQPTGAIRLNEALDGLTKVAIKCDAEGAEATIFNEADLSKVYVMELECHYHVEETLIPKLIEKGFNCGLLPRKSADLVLLRCQKR